MSSPPEYTGNAEDFLSRRYRGHHIPETEGEKLWADVGKLEESLDTFGEELRFTARVLNRLLKYETNIRRLESVTPEAPPVQTGTLEDTSAEKVSHVEYERLTGLLNELAQRAHYYEKDCVGRMEVFLTKHKGYKPTLGKGVVAVLKDVPLTESRKLRFRIMDLQERFTHDKRRHKELRGFVRDDMKFIGFD